MLKTVEAKSGRSLNDIVYDEEDVFREVKDWALILFDEKVALCRVAGKLLEAGNKIDELFDELFAINLASRPKAVAS